jgi:hypothetical protein
MTDIDSKEAASPSELELRLQQLAMKEQHVTLQFKWIFRIGILLLIIIPMVAMFFYGSSLDADGVSVVNKEMAEAATNAWIVALIVVLGMIAAKFFKSNVLFRSQQERVRLEYDKNFAAKYPVIDQAVKEDYYASLVKLNLDNLQRNYELVRIHSHRSFLTSISVASSGMTLILIGLLVGIFRGGEDGDKTVTIVSASAGVITTFISAMFFVMYSKTVTQMKGYHDSLLNVQDVLLAFKVVQDAQNPTTREVMMTSLLTTLVSVKNYKDL